MSRDSRSLNFGHALRSGHLRKRGRVSETASKRIAAAHFDGRRVTAHTYRYVAGLMGVSEIASGDYLDWVRSRL